MVPTRSALTLWRHARLVTLTGTDWGLIEEGAILTDGEHISWVGPEERLPCGLAVQAEYDLGGALVTPGLIDCHTHLIYAGRRADEAELRFQGASYAQIARVGGGIRVTVAATRAASNEELLRLAIERARTLRSQGVTTLEIKSGYGLTLEDEARCLRLARRLAQVLGLSVRTTFLGAHAVPPEFADRSDDYIEAVCAWMPVLQAEGLIDAVDAFCEHIGFTPAQTRRVFETARRLGLPVKLHAEQLSDQGGAALAASYGALSCDHLEYLDPSGIAAMRAAGTVAVLLPGAYYMLRETKRPPVPALREAGIPMAVATDHNPGSSPTLSLPLMAHMACVLFGLTPQEAVRGITVQAARALGLYDRGTLAPGQRADLAVWALDHPNELCYWFGHNSCTQVVIGGETIA
jgi:imidazolonepropionase